MSGWFRWKKPRLHMSLRTVRHFPPDIKSVLMHLNLVMDTLLWNIQSEERNYTSLFQSYVLTDYEKIVLLLEDKRFLLHSGFDIYCIPRAVKRLILQGRIGGVSTIEQQFVRTVLDARERTAKNTGGRCLQLFCHIESRKHQSYART
jgi:membrane carboxypeptidase/penicillin-binding protein PbpC